MRIRTDHTSEPIAIIGMACRLPGAENLDQYWQLISEGLSALGEVPPERLDQSLYYDPRKGTRGKTYSKVACLLSHRRFDHQRCPIDEQLMRSVDNTHLLMTGVAADALRHAGLDPFNLASRKAAVFIGHAQGSSRLGELTYRANLDDALALLDEAEEFQQLSASDRSETRRELKQRILNRLPPDDKNPRFLYCNMVAGTIAKAFGLSGPWLALNSACASSLHAMLMGARALQRGRSDMVIVGGASDCKSDSLILFSHAQAMSATDSRPFDAAADGLIMSEGYVCLVMKTLRKALADGDPIQAVVRGLGVATDGRGKSLWAPRKEGQIRAMQRAYRSGADISRLQYLECHATATQVGDATELDTLSEVLKPMFPAGKRIPISSVKANIGHSLEAAGVAGMIKTVLCMQHQVIPRAINVETLNPKIDWQSSPCYVPLRPERWEAPADGGPRAAAVNAFGIGGLNMHVVIDEYTPTCSQLIPSNRLPEESADDRAVAIVGMSCILPGANSIEALWKMLCDGGDPKTDPDPVRWSPKSRRDRLARGGSLRAGFLTDYEYDWRKHKVPPKQVAEADPLQFMLLDACEQSLLHAGLTSDTLDRERTGVVVGVEFGGDFCDQLEMGLRLPEMEHLLGQTLAPRLPSESIGAIQRRFHDRLLEKWPSLIDETGSFTSSTLASRISKTLDLAGGAVAIDSGSTSAMSGLSICIDAILSGDNDLMICAAGQRRMGPAPFEAMDSAGVLAKGEAHSVIDQRYDGIVPAEGAVAVALKRLADARRDGDRIHAVIRGIGIAHDRQTAEALRMAASQAHASAGVEASEVSLVELDTDEPLGPSALELDAVAATHTAGARQTPLVMNSSTAQWGHLGGASPLTAVIKASLEIEHGSTSPAAAVHEPSTALAKWSGRVLPATESFPMQGRRLAAVACWSKGQACYMILEHGDPTTLAPRPRTPAQRDKPLVTPAPPTPGSSSMQICRFGAETLEGVLTSVKQAISNSAEAWQAAAERQFSSSDRVRLAIVAESASSLDRKLKLALPQMNNPAARQVMEQQGIFCREAAPKSPRVVGVFPGQGSQYEGMFKALVEQSPAAAAMMAKIDEALTRQGHPTFPQLAWSSPCQLGRDIWVTQVSLLCANAICHAALAEFGIHPDLVLGHSYGEFSALLAAGVWDLDTAIRLTKARCDGVAAAVATSSSGMLATDAPARVAEQLAAAHDLQAFAANLNAPDQTVLGGDRETLASLARVLQKEGHHATILRVPAAFHTPLMRGASQLLEQSLATAELHSPKTPVVSTVSNALVSSPTDVRRNLAQQLTTSVRYAELIARLAAEAPSVFVEVGPQQTLSRLNRRILGADCSAIAGDNAKRPGLEPILSVQALLECLGVICPTSLPENRRQERPPRVSVPPSPEHSPVESVTRIPPLKGGDMRETTYEHIPHFDATERRREKMRASGGASKPVAGVSAANAVMSPELGPAPRQIPSAPSMPPSSTAAAPDSPAASGGPNIEELETFLINFVVEQTGYPAEVVELDADLEADLGIDSIKKAQLLGELQEYFEIGSSAENLSLDDFPTLRHVLDFLASTESAPSSEVAPAAAPSNAAEVPQAASTANAPTPLPGAEPAVAAASTSHAPDVQELEAFLINFVVEQTGYPAEVVELDADLEADLGIDSIKKAQLLGELQEYFEIGSSAENLSLDDFPTLRHVLDFLASANSVPPASPEDVESTGQLPATPDPAPVVADSHFTPAPAASPKPLAVVEADDLEAFLINFVVEQTGYPAEVVDLDADLEADLGIDSIKKAQLLGELQEYFEIGSSAENLSLDDFPTLRHVLDFLGAANDAAPTCPVNGDTQSADSAVGETPIAFEGTPYEIGFQHGKRFHHEIRQTLRDYVELAGPNLEELPGAPDRDLITERLSADELDELQGIADAVEIPLGNLLASHFAVAADWGANAGQMALTAETNREGRMVHAVDQPLPELAALQSATRPLVSVRIPSRGLRHTTVSFLGSTVTLAGVNTAGVAITAFPTESRGEGRLPSAIVRDILQNARELDHAIRIASQATSSAPWAGCLSHVGSDRVALIEFDGENLSVRSDEACYATGEFASLAKAETALAAETRGGLAYAESEPIAIRGEQLVAELENVGVGSEQWFSSDRPTTRLTIAIEPAVGALWVNDSRYGARCFRLEQMGAAPAAGSSNPGAEAPATPSEVLELGANPVTTRFRLTMREAPLPSGVATEPTFSGSAIVLGEGRTAEALQEQLKQRGVTVHRLTGEPDPAAVLTWLEKICSAGPAPHLFIASGRDARRLNLDDSSQYRRQREEALLTPFFVCQKWLELAEKGEWLENCTIVATVAMGGDFGLRCGAELAQGGAVAGLLKAIFIEYTIMRRLPGLRVKVIDAWDNLGREALVDHVFQELAADQLDCEVAYAEGRRWVPTAKEAPANVSPSQLRDIRRGGVWVVTGGARGISAACALELGQRFGLKLHLIGASPQEAIDPAWRHLDAEGLQKLKAETMIAARHQGDSPPAAWRRIEKQLEIDRTLRAMANAGVEASYHACDVSDRAALGRVLDMVRAADGPIEGVLHGAGIDRSCRFTRKQREVVEQTIAAKVDGAAHLIALTRRDPVRHFLGFGSISGRLGSFGQTDYCLASDMLCKLLGSLRRQRPWIKAVSFHWHPWDEVGMAARPETKNVLQGVSELRLMPLREGIAHLMRELATSSQEPEVMFTERRHWDRFERGLRPQAEPVAPSHNGKHVGGAHVGGRASVGGEHVGGEYVGREHVGGRALAGRASPAVIPVAAKEETQRAFTAEEHVVSEGEVELLTHRCEIRTLVAPLPESTPAVPTFDSGVWVFGDGPEALALESRLRRMGTPVVRFSPNDTLENTLPEIDRQWSRQPAASLFLMNARDSSKGDLLADNAASQRRKREIMAPITIAQRWVQHLLSQPEPNEGNLVALTSLGGAFGFSGRVAVPEGGALAGLLKAARIESSRRENHKIRSKVFDFPTDEPAEAVVDQMLRELAADEPEVEVCWARGERRVVRPIPTRLRPRPGAKIPEGGTWVVTGGARGITAIAARELAKRYQWKLHLVGKSPAPVADAPWRDHSAKEMKDLKMRLAREAVSQSRSPAEAWDRVMKDVEIFDNLQRIADDGVQATYHACDISDREAVARVVRDIHALDGPIHGILHGAGLIDPGRFEHKRLDFVERLIGAKFDGLLHLLSLTQDDPLTHCIGFGSISGRFGGNGLTDYAAGNEAMSKLIDWLSTARPNCRAATIHWESWEGSGMATLPRFAWGPRSIMNMKYMEPEEGVRRLEQELAAGLPNREVLYTFGDFYPMFYPEEQRPLGEFVPGRMDPVDGENVEARSLVTDLVVNGNQTLAQFRLDPATDVFLRQHLLCDNPLLPVVVGLESLAETARAATGKSVTGFRQVEMVNGLRFHTDRPVTAQVQATQQPGAGTTQCVLVCDFANRAGKVIQKARPYLKAQVVCAEAPQALPSTLPPVPNQWSSFSYPEDSMLYHGPVFRGVKAVQLGAHDGWGRIEALPLENLVGAQRAADWIVPSCVLDAAFYVCGVHLWMHSASAISLPRSIDRLDLGRAPNSGEECLVRFTCREQTRDGACYDFTVIGEDGAMILRAQGYHKVILAQGGGHE